MPLVEFDPFAGSSGIPTSTGMPDRAPIEAPGVGQTVGAAFRQENAVVGALDLIRRPTFEPQEGYRPSEDPDLKDTTYIRDYGQRLARAQSPAEAQSIVSRIEKERSDQEMLDRAGWGGTIASIGAGLTDPTLFIPGTGVVKVARGAARVAYGAARVGAEAAAVTAGQELILQGSQETRTATQSALAIGGAALIGGVLGGAAAGLSRNEFHGLADRYSPVGAGDSDLPYITRGGSGGAALTAEARGSGDLESTLGADRVFSGVSPVTRLQTSEFAGSKNIIRDMADAGLMLKENAEGIATSVGGNIENRVAMRRGDEAVALRFADEQFAAYHGRADTRINRAIMEGQEVMAGWRGGDINGKLTRKQFNEQVGIASRNGDEHPIAEVQAVARQRRKLFDEDLRRAQEVGLLPADVQVTTAKSYFPRKWDKAKIAANRTEFKKLLQSIDLDEQASDDLIDTLLGVPDSRVADLDLTPGPRGSLRERTFQIPDNFVQDWLINDADEVLRTYRQSMVPDTELYSKFGSVDLSGQIKSLRDEANARAEKAEPKEAVRILARVERDIRDIEAIRDRLRGTYELPSDPGGLASRAGRVLRNLNFLTMLGGMTISAIPDLARPVMVYGWKALGPAASAFGDVARGVKSAPVEELNRFGVAIDMITEGRASLMGDVEDAWRPGRSGLERGLEWASNKFGMATLMAPWDTALKQTVGVNAIDFILSASSAIRAGSATPKQISALAAGGIDASLAKRIAAAAEAEGGSSIVRGLKLSNTEAWTDRIAADAIAAAVVRDVNRIIVSPGVEKPLFMSSEVGKVLGQFKSFAFASNSRVMLAGLQQRDAQMLSGVILSMGLGGLTYAVKQTLRGEDVGDTNSAQWAVEALDNSGLMALPLELNNISEKATRGTIGLSALTGEQVSRYASRNLTSGLLGPSFGRAQDTIDIFGAATSGEWDDNASHTVRKNIPLQNLFWLRGLFDQLENSARDKPLGN